MASLAHIHGKEHLVHIYRLPNEAASTDQNAATCAALTGMLQRHVERLSVISSGFVPLVRCQSEPCTRTKLGPR